MAWILWSQYDFVIWKFGGSIVLATGDDPYLLQRQINTLSSRLTHTTAFDSAAMMVVPLAYLPYW